MRIITATILASMIAVAPIADAAATPITVDPAATYPTQEDADDLPWGLLGLLGLAGLLGLKRRDNDGVRTGRTTSR